MQLPLPSQKLNTWKYTAVMLSPLKEERSLWLKKFEKKNDTFPYDHREWTNDYLFKALKIMILLVPCATWLLRHQAAILSKRQTQRMLK